MKQVSDKVGIHATQLQAAWEEDYLLQILELEPLGCGCPDSLFWLLT